MSGPYAILQDTNDEAILDIPESDMTSHSTVSTTKTPPLVQSYEPPRPAASLPAAPLPTGNIGSSSQGASVSIQDTLDEPVMDTIVSKLFVSCLD